MSNETATTAKGLFAGKARTVAAVAAFSGLALATTVSVQATQNADEQAPAAAVSEAPASENTVSAEPAAKADKAEKAAKSETKKTDKAEAAAPAVQTSVVEAAPVADVTPLQAPAAQAPATQAPVVTTASENVTPVAEQAPVSQGRHAAPASQQTIQAEAAAQNYTAVSNTTIPDTTGTQSQNTGWTGHATADVEKTQTPVAETPASTTKVSTQSTSGQSSSAKGKAILGAAQDQIGVNQDCTALVSNSLKAVGINFHGWPAEYKSLGTAVSADQAQAGDIAYYADGGAGVAHVAIYAGNGQAVHGGWNGNQTVQTTANVGSGPEYIRVG
ncbi:MAG: C40 family peptidase [Kocuria rhizophila]|uniref:C40 family peptidase n=1 Tax=Kocuria salsicia TaxID=664639 RepID=UPI001EC327B4|nr:C40 family peptidase [Kocuria rhizophila]